MPLDRIKKKKTKKKKSTVILASDPSVVLDPCWDLYSYFWRCTYCPPSFLPVWTISLYSCFKEMSSFPLWASSSWLLCSSLILSYFLSYVTDNCGVPEGQDIFHSHHSYMLVMLHWYAWCDFLKAFIILCATLWHTSPHCSSEFICDFFS